MYHNAVLLEQSVELLRVKPDGVYVDATFGGGGHSGAILESLGKNGKLFGFDQDPDAVENALDDERFQFVHANFSYLKSYMKLYAQKELDGILADLGVSSHQFDSESRGFSYRFDSKLDMRMSQSEDLTAAVVVNTYSQDDLQRIFSSYGELRNSKTLAQQIVRERRHMTINSVGEFVTVIEPVIRGQRMKYLSQVFQALRIEVNDEMAVLSEFLKSSFDILKPGGRMVVISYHSLEDRLVKQFFRTGDPEGEVRKDFYGNIYRPFKLLHKGVITAGQDELKSNPRARSARMRAAEKIKES